MQFKDVFTSAATGGASSTGKPPTELSAAALLEKYPAEILQPVAARALELLNSLPPHSHFRSGLLGVLMRDLPPSRAACLAGVDESTIRKAVHAVSEGGLGEFEQKYAVGVTRERIPQLELDVIVQFLKDNCPPRSGTTREHYMQLLTGEDLYNKHRSDYPKLLAQVVSQAESGLAPSEKLSSLR